MKNNNVAFSCTHDQNNISRKQNNNTGNKKKFKLPESSKKWIRLITVILYVICVSLAAVVLAVYYIMIWKPNTQSSTNEPQTTETSILYSVTTPES